jgi:rubrerythrin
MTTTRRQALAAGAALPLLLATAPRAFAASVKDEQKMRYEEALVATLHLEQTAVVAYEAIANSGHLSDPAVVIFRDLLDDEKEHVAQLEIAIEETDAKPPIPPRRAVIEGLAGVRSDTTAARFAIALEEHTIAAYTGTVRDFVDASVLRVVAGAMGTDGQHLVVLREMLGANPVPGAFEQGQPG